MREGYDGARRDGPSKADDLPTQENVAEKIGKGAKFVSGSKQEAPTIEKVSKDLGKNTKFISAADKFNVLSEEDKEEVETVKTLGVDESF